MELESPLERTKRLTQAEVDAGRLRGWVMGDEAARDRMHDAEDRRAAFHIVRDPTP